MNTYEIHSITNKMPSALIDGFLLGIFWNSGTGETTHTERGYSSDQLIFMTEIEERMHPDN